ncbi:MAG: FecR family protein [Chromatiales bacterium]|jgi:hypothetical protein|nr:FecR family protein [Chromatiales bacterium]MDX9766805.1 FecR family protein [Ectothiorhodospiraceae bacterium]
MRPIHTGRIPFILALGLLLLCLGMSSSLAAQEAAKVVASVGDAVVVSADGKRRALARGDAVMQGDTVRTGANTRVQLRFTDGSLLFLRPESVFRIDEYRYGEQAGGGNKASMSLIKGGLRTITGAVGRQDRSEYQVNTPVATIGIRGTHYALRLCAGDCASGTYNPRDGLYGKVLQGRIVSVNRGGEHPFDAGQQFHVRDIDSPPRLLMQSPPGLFDDGNGLDTRPGTDDTPTAAIIEENVSSPMSQPAQFRANEQTDSDTGLPPGVEPPSNEPPPEEPPPTDPPPTDPPPTDPPPTDPPPTDPPPTDPPPTDPPPTDPIENGVAGSIIMRHIEGVAAGGWIDHGMVCDGDDNCLVPGELTDRGQHAGLGVEWGRWDADPVLLRELFGSDVSLLSEHFMYSTNVTPYETVQTLGHLGSVTFQYAGGTAPMDETGMTGRVNEGWITADFVNQQFTDMHLDMSVGDRNYQAGFGIFGGASFANVYSENGSVMLMQGNCTGGLCGNGTDMIGSIGMMFVGPQAEGIMSGFGLMGETANGPIGVTGTGLFIRP